jgi:hypothetical protein
MEEEPIVGAMYEEAEGRRFTVLSFDEDEATIEVEYEDGTVEGMDLDAWYELEAQQVESDDDEEVDDDYADDESDDEDDLDEDEDDLDEEEEER